MMWRISHAAVAVVMTFGGFGVAFSEAGEGFDRTRAHVITSEGVRGGSGGGGVSGPEFQRVDAANSAARVRVYDVTPEQVAASRARASEPAFPHLVELRIVDQVIYVDPRAELRRDHYRGLDRNHSLRRAQRYDPGEPTRSRARVIRPAGREGASEGPIVPEAIFYRPGILGPQAPEGSPHEVDHEGLPEWLERLRESGPEGLPVAGR